MSDVDCSLDAMMREWKPIDKMPNHILVLVRDDNGIDRSYELAIKTKSYLPWFGIVAIEWCYIPGTEPGHDQHLQGQKGKFI